MPSPMGCRAAANCLASRLVPRVLTAAWHTLAYPGIPWRDEKSTKQRAFFGRSAEFLAKLVRFLAKLLLARTCDCDCNWSVYDRLIARARLGGAWCRPPHLRVRCVRRSGRSALQWSGSYPDPAAQARTSDAHADRRRRQPPCQERAYGNYTLDRPRPRRGIECPRKRRQRSDRLGAERCALEVSRCRGPSADTSPMELRSAAHAGGRGTTSEEQQRGLSSGHEVEN
jgi:hypothetical protein